MCNAKRLQFIWVQSPLILQLILQKLRFLGFNA